MFVTMGITVVVVSGIHTSTSTHIKVTIPSIIPYNVIYVCDKITLSGFYKI